MGAKPSFYMKFIATYAPAFFGYNNPVLARVAKEYTLVVVFVTILTVNTKLDAVLMIEASNVVLDACRALLKF